MQVSHNFGVNGNPFDEVKRNLWMSSMENFGQISRKILSCIALARVVFSCK